MDFANLSFSLQGCVKTKIIKLTKLTNTREKDVKQEGLLRSKSVHEVIHFCMAVNEGVEFG